MTKKEKWLFVIHMIVYTAFTIIVAVYWHSCLIDGS